MAIQTSGPISFSDLAVEFGDTPPYSFSEFYRDGGKVPSVNANVAASGAIRLGTFFGAVNELLQTVTANASINAQTIFGSDWGSDVPKRLSIPSGVTIGPLTIPTGMGGTLEVDVAGEIQGLGGSANGGAGGNAITANSRFTLNVFSGGAVRGGGGGGGLGGTGGGGSYTSITTYGPRYNGSAVWKTEPWANRARITYYYDGFTMAGELVSGTNSTSYSVPSYLGGPATARRGTYQGSYYSQGNGTGYEYSIYVERSSTVNTNGGSGGAGGRGRGYGQTLASGSGGSAGGTNAGTGGTGGSGGDWGASGATGSTGANGNRTNGVAGSSGGAAGRAVLMNAGTVTVNNSGTINGAY
jgi:hypothetical protein